MTVVVGFIPDVYGEAALDAAVVEAGRRETDLVVVNASRGDSLIDTRFVGGDDARTLGERLEALDVRTELRQAVGGDIAESIIEVIDETDADMVVIGLRHRTQVGKMLMGSVAQRILLEAPCQVLAVKPA